MTILFWGRHMRRPKLSKLQQRLIIWMQLHRSCRSRLRLWQWG